MGKPIIISESEKKDILAKYGVISEQERTMIDKVYGLIKNLPLVRKIEKSYDSDIKKHLMNLVGIVPKLKGKENELLSNIKDDNQSTEELASKINSEISKIGNSSLNEQPIPKQAFINSYRSNTPLVASTTVPAGWLIAVPTLIFLFLFIRKIILDKKKLNKPTNTEVDGPCKCSSACGEYRVTISSLDNPNAYNKGSAATLQVYGCDCESYDYSIQDISKPITVCACDEKKDNIVALNGAKINVTRIGDCKKPLDQQQGV